MPARLFARLPTEARICLHRSVRTRLNTKSNEDKHDVLRCVSAHLFSLWVSVSQRHKLRWKQSFNDLQ
jgi:hypothetical protein